MKKPIRLSQFSEASLDLKALMPACQRLAEPAYFTGLTLYYSLRRAVKQNDNRDVLTTSKAMMGKLMNHE